MSLLRSDEYVEEMTQSPGMGNKMAEECKVIGKSKNRIVRAYICDLGWVVLSEKHREDVGDKWDEHRVCLTPEEWANLSKLRRDAK